MTIDTYGFTGKPLLPLRCQLLDDRVEPIVVLDGWNAFEVFGFDPNVRAKTST